MATTIEISNLSKSYTKGKQVLRPLDLTIQGGELFFLLGPSGCGKSTLLRILSGLLEPDAGSHIAFNGQDITNLPPEKRRAAMVFQNYALWPHLTVFENVAFGLKAAKKPASEVKKAVMEALELVKLTEFAERKIPSLSGGQQQRVALARAIAVKPAVLLLDEPLSNLDARLRDAMRTEIHRIVKASQLTAVYVTHDRKEALATADRLAVLHNGVLQQCGTPRQMYLQPANAFVAEFLGETNILSATILPNGKLSTPIGELTTAQAVNFPADTQVKVLFRPEQLIESTNSNAMNVFDAQIVGETYLGEYSSYTLKSGETQLKYTRLSPPENAVNNKLKLSIPAAGLCVVKE